MPYCTWRTTGRRNISVAYRIDVATREVWVLLIGDRQTIWDVREGEILDRFVEQLGTRPFRRKRIEAEEAAATAPRVDCPKTPSYLRRTRKLLS